jgi:hypothetical protein
MDAIVAPAIRSFRAIRISPIVEAVATRTRPASSPGPARTDGGSRLPGRRRARSRRRPAERAATGLGRLALRLSAQNRQVRSFILQFEVGARGSSSAATRSSRTGRTRSRTRNIEEDRPGSNVVVRLDDGRQARDDRGNEGAAQDAGGSAGARHELPDDPELRTRGTRPPRVRHRPEDRPRDGDREAAKSSSLTTTDVRRVDGLVGRRRRRAVQRLTRT